MALSYQAMLKAVQAVVAAGNVPNIVGTAGIGKSALVSDVAQRMHARLFTTVVSLAEKGDLSIPVPPLRDEAFVKTSQYGTLANVQFGYSETLVEIVKNAEAHPDQAIIWFLDEFNRGTSAVQSELMNVVLQRQVNSLHLPAQVHIIIAENPDSSMEGFGESNYAVTPADAAIKDRTVRLVMQASLTDWLTWAKEDDGQCHQRIAPLVIKYLENHPDQLNRVAVDLGPTPRAWQRVSQNLRQLQKLSTADQRRLMPDVFSGDLGIETGTDFATFVLQGAQLNDDDLQKQSIEKISSALQELSEGERLAQLQKMVTVTGLQIFTDSNVISKLPSLIDLLSPDGQYALGQTIGKIAREHPDEFRQFYQMAADDFDAEKLYRQLSQIAVQE